MEWSQYQEDIFDAINKVLDRDLVVLARAGTGKTTTMIEAVIRFCEMNPQARVLTCAFNRKSAEDLAEKLQSAGLKFPRVAAQTLNGVGLSTCKRAWGKSLQTDPRKGRTVAQQVAQEHQQAVIEAGETFGFQEKQRLATQISKLAQLAKATLTPHKSRSALRSLSDRFGLTTRAEVKILVSLTSRALFLSTEQPKTEDPEALFWASPPKSVDFDDQIWFPHLFDLTPYQADLVIVDEAQDMNAAQLSLARKAVKPGGRLVAVGDDRQAIYSWRGADSGFLNRMIDELNAAVLPLPRTYRCGHAIVREAQQLVPDYEADESNELGQVTGLSTVDMFNMVRPGDFILSRLNAPLLSICLTLLKDRVPASIQGRDIMGQLIGLIKHAKCHTVAALLNFLPSYELREHKKLRKADAEPEIISALLDRVACLRVLAQEHTYCEDLVKHLDTLFRDHADAAKVILSSIHRAKGLERDRVFLLKDTFRADGGSEENNIRYVAITRAKSALYYVMEDSK